MYILDVWKINLKYRNIALANLTKIKQWTYFILNVSKYLGIMFLPPHFRNYLRCLLCIDSTLMVAQKQLLGLMIYKFGNIYTGSGKQLYGNQVIHIFKTL